MLALRRSMAAAAMSACASTLVWTAGPAEAQAPRAGAKPNILFVILDDVGIDQMPMFGFGGLRPPVLPNMTMLADKGVKFTNVWAMPQCSSSRTSFFTGRLPSRTGVGLAILENHLPQTYLSSYEVTVPRMLQTAGYRSALVGKYHLGNERDPAGDCAPTTRGFDGFFGNMTAGPPSIDSTGGGTAAEGTFVCGYSQTSASGACYVQTAGSIACAPIGPGNAAPLTSPARTCLQRGGIFTPGAACGANPPDAADFKRYNAYYVWPRTALGGAKAPTWSACSVEPTVNRTYMTIGQQQDGVSWWKAQSGPRMLTLSFNAIHTPLQKPPTSLVPDPADVPATCNAMLPDRNTINAALEGTDTALGRALAQMGLATLRPDGRTIDTLNLTDTMVVIIGDNGSFGPTVRAPDGFEAGRSKGTTYQTGVWVPLIVAGPQVASPGRSVDELVNAVDLFDLFAGIAGVDPNKTVPNYRRLDAKPIHAYLTNPQTGALRTVNYTEINQGTFSADPADRSWPCVIGSQCSEVLFPTEEFCHDNGGTWYGPGAAKQYTSCCAVSAANPSANITLMPISQRAARTKAYKLVRNETMDCARPLAGSGQQPAVPWAEYATRVKDEFYDVRKVAGTNPTGMDFAANDKLASCKASDPASCLTADLRPVYAQLSATIGQIERETVNENKCRARGDGNMDMRITAADIEGYRAFAGKGPSRYDINVDGETDEDDLAIIKANVGKDCLSVCQRADLDRNDRVDAADVTLAMSVRGTCTGATCQGDFNGDGKVDDMDVARVQRAVKTCGKKPRDRYAEVDTDED